MATVAPVESFLVGTWLSLVEHSLGVRGVGSSNLPVPTNSALSFSSAFSSCQRHFNFQRHHSADSISSAIASIFVTLFQLRAVPVVFSSFPTDAHGSLDLPAPLGK
jgi:hypothetical protein